MTTPDTVAGPLIAVVADDLIWASRLLAAVQQGGASPVRMGTDSDVELAFEAVTLSQFDPTDPLDLEAPPRLVGAIIDLFGHRYDGVGAVRLATAAGLPVVAIAQHDDQETRKLALEAGALRVYSYNKFFQDGPALVTRWFVSDTAEDTRSGVTAHAIPASSYARRIAAAQAAAQAAGVRALLIGVGPELEWLTGYEAKPLERLTMLVVPAEGDPAIVTPRLEVAAAEQSPGIGSGGVRIRSWLETEDSLDLMWESVPSGPGGRLVVSDTLRAAFLLRLQATFPDTAFEIASPVVGPLRRAKDATEVALLRAAAHAADRVVTGLAAGRLVGRTEADVAAEVRTRLLDEGHDSASFWIVASGPRSASPHHEPDDRIITAGEPLLLDIGGRLGGYSSDITRTLWLAGADGASPDDTFRTIHSLVLAANQAGTAAVRPGVPAQDRAARAVIEAAGYGAAFFHRLGHGIGLEGHEDPYLVEGNGAPLIVGDAFSIEPGIYLEGRYGVRIEDIVVCGEHAADVLNEAPRELLVVSGT